jgi:hypothetical protein
VPTSADIVWNRACAEGGDGVGDRHLRALLRVHGMVMNGGPSHAAEVCDGAEIAAAAESCRYFGLDRLAVVVLALPAAASGADGEAAEEQLDAAYSALVPHDSIIGDAFETRYATTPGDFDPISQPSSQAENSPPEHR